MCERNLELLLKSVGDFVDTYNQVFASVKGEIDPTNGEPTRVKAGAGQDGRTERISVKSGNPIPRPR